MNRGKLTRTSLFMGLLFILMGVKAGVFAKEVPFTLEDRDRLIRIEAKLEQHDKQFEQGDKRISELRQDMNKRFEQLTHFLYILSGIFTALVVAVIGFAYWDRRTIIREARREAIEFMEKEGMLRRILDALRELSREDTRLAEALRRFNLL